MRTPAVHLAVWADTRCLPPGDIQALARGMEEITVRAALDPAAVTGI